jgi:hypothetical protein
MKTTNEHIENEFPTLEKLKTAKGMKTPQGFFDSLSTSIMEQTVEQPKQKKISFYRVFAYAASIAIVVGISSTFFFGNVTQSTPELFGEMTVNEYLEDFSEIDLELEDALQFDEIATN